MLRFSIYLIGATFILLVVMNLISSAVLLRDSLIAAGMSAANALTGYYLAVSGADKEHSGFIKIVFGGMTLRLLTLVFLTVLLIRMEWVEAIPFFLMLMGFYVLHQIMELTALNRKIKSGLKLSQKRRV
ncbi:MAG TPA: hypothetical protein ENN84_05855 [Candidatus Marinimicrobia bacterium]|nr:hypothetical protein [Candidatus Neomarinimicrobiota bacterium]